MTCPGIRRVVACVVAAVMVLAARTSLAADTNERKEAKGVYDYEGQHKAPAGTKRIVFIATHGTHGGIGSHEFLAGSLYLARRINAVYPNAWAVVYTEDKWPKDLSDADAIVVMLNHGGRAAEDPLVKAACDKGAGYMAVHFGVEVNKGKQGDNYLSWIGGYFETFYSVNPFWKPEVQVNSNHPTARGVKPFSLVDEWYYHMRFVDGMEGVTPILSAVPPLNTVHFNGKPSDRGGNADVLKAVQQKQPQVLAWAYERKVKSTEGKGEGKGEGKSGRGFGFTGFHVYNNLANDSFRTTLLNGVAWVSGLDVPEGGVPSATPTKEDLAEYLHAAHPDMPTDKLK